jgi:hypothetical protein
MRKQLAEAVQAGRDAYARVSAIPYLGWMLAPLAAVAAASAIATFEYLARPR